MYGVGKHMHLMLENSGVEQAIAATKTKDSVCLVHMNYRNNCTPENQF